MTLLEPLIKGIGSKGRRFEKTVFDWGGEDNFEFSPVVNEKSIV